MTIAEEIAAQFDNDHKKETNARGENIRRVCEHERKTAQTNQELELVKYTFKDNSCITLSLNGGWDVGYPNCCCWKGVGHRGECENTLMD